MNKSFPALALELKKQIDKEAEIGQEDRAAKWTRNYVMWRGGLDTFGFWKQGRWNQLTNLDDLYPDNVYAEKFNVLIATLSAAQVKLVVESTGGGDESKKSGGKRVGQRMVNAEVAKVETADFLALELARALNYGCYFRYQYFDKTAGAKTRIPKLGNGRMETPDSYSCPNCGTSGPMNSNSCPMCGSQNVMQMKGTEQTFPKHDGYEDVDGGDTKTISVDPFEVSLAPESRDMETAPWLRWQRRVRTQKVKQAYKLKDSDLKSHKAKLPYMLEAQQALEKMTDANANSSGAGSWTVLSYYWLDDFMYFDQECEESYKCKSGNEIKPSPLGEQFKSGLCLVYADDELIDATNESKLDYWTGAQYYRDSNSPWGKGMDDAADIQMWISDMHSMVIAHARHDSFGFGIYNSSAFPKGAPPNRPGVYAPADLFGEMTIDNVMKQFQPNQLSQSPLVALEYGRKDMTAAVGAYGVMAGTNEQAPETATATSLLREQAVGGLAPMLQRRAEMSAKWAKQGLRLKQKFYSYDHYVPFLEENEFEEGRFFSSADIDSDFIVRWERGSEMPQTRLDKLADLERASMFAQLPGGIFNPQVPAGMRDHAISLFNLPRDVTDSQRDIEVAKRRINEIKEIMKVAESQGAPLDMEGIEMILATVPSLEIIPEIENHAIHMDVYRKWMLDNLDDSQETPSPSVMLAMRSMFARHKLAALGVAQEQTAMQVASQQPIQDVAQDEQAQIAEQQQAMSQQEQQAEGQRQQDSQIQAEAGHERQVELKTMDAEIRQREQQANRDQQSTMAKEKMRNDKTKMQTRQNQRKVKAKKIA